MPVFKCSEKALEDALNLLARGIETVANRSTINTAGGLLFRQDESGVTLEEMPDEDTSGRHDSPYEMGTTAYGSDDPENPTARPALTSAMTDTGIVGIQPLDYVGSDPTFGFNVQVVTRRIFYNPASGAFDVRMFVRDLIFDSKGRLYKITAEKIVEESNIVGTGSNGGGI
jgi:hypothetical protein